MDIRRTDITPVELPQANQKTVLAEPPTDIPLGEGMIPDVAFEQVAEELFMKYDNDERRVESQNCEHRLSGLRASKV